MGLYVLGKNVETIMGIAPENVPTYLALTDSSNHAAINSRQAIRLVESYGNIDLIYANLGQLVSALIRRKLTDSEFSIRQCYRAMRCNPLGAPMGKSIGDISLIGLDTTHGCELVVRYGFHSLLRLLVDPPDVRLCPRILPVETESYHVVVDQEHLKILESIIRASELCSIDTESDDKDPRAATLLGISFSVKEGEAHFVPLIETDLHNLTSDNVLDVLKRIFRSDVRFVGHNIKYDSLLLGRYGISVKGIHFDTMLAAVECHGDWPFFNLPYVCDRYLGKKLKAYSDIVREGRTFLDLPLKEMVSHACQDADMTGRLYPILMAELKEKGISGQFFTHTMPRCQRLCNLEADGIKIRVERLKRIIKRLSGDATRLRSEIFRMAGREFDLEASNEMLDVFREIADARGYVGPRRMTLAALEHLALVEPIARLVVQVKRIRSRIARLQSIITASRNGKIYPVFNQIKYHTGLVASDGPSIFDIEGVADLKACFDPSVRDLFVDATASLIFLAQATNDPVLIKVANSKPNHKPLISRQQMLDDQESVELLLAFAVGQSDTVISKRFLLDRMTIASIRQESENKYKTTFAWLSSFRKQAGTKCYATKGDLRHYIDGLKSSDVSRRSLSLEYSVRWLIGY
jgi:DNA polymerase-1